MIVKLAFKNEIKICSSVTTFAYLLKQVKTLFPTSPKLPNLSYIDSDGDMITISSDSDVDSLKDYSNGKVVKIIVSQLEFKETASQNQDLEDFEVIVDEDKIFQEIVLKNLNKVYKRATEKANEEQEEMIMDLAKLHVYQIGQKALSNILTQLNSSRFQIKIEAKSKTSRSKSFDCVKSEKQIERLVDKKIKTLIPTLIERVVKLVEIRGQRQSNHNCQQCSKYKKFISQTLLKRSDQCNEEEYDDIYEMALNSKAKKY